MNNIKKIQEKLIEKNLDAVLVTDEKNQRYATGFPFTDGAVIVARSAAWLITDSRYIEAATNTAACCCNVQMFDREHSRLSLIQAALKEAGVERLGAEEEKLSHAEYLGYEKALGMELLPAQAIFSELRASKSEEEIGYLHGQLGDMTEINDSNVRMKQIFELQLVNQKDSLGKIYEITSSLDQYGAYEVLFYAAQTISKLMNTEDVAVYTVANQSYARLFSFTSPTARKLGNSIRYPEMEAMYTDLKERRVFINKTMDERYPLMAQAIYAEDEMQIILMLWGLPWDRMNLAESNRLTVISYLIQNAVVRANRYLEALREHRYLGNSSILEKEAFTQLVSAFFEAKRNGLTECSLVKITCGEEKYLEAAEVLGKKLRQTDYVGMLDGGLYVLLSDTEEKNALGVITRFAEAGYESTIANGEVAA